MAGYSVLGPIQTPQQRLAQRIVDIEHRISDMERALPSVSVSNIDPIGTPVAGAQHLNDVQGRFFVYTGTEWITADSQRYYAEDLTTISEAPSAEVYDYAGPSVTFEVQDTGFFAIAAQVDLFGNGGGLDFTDVGMRATGANSFTSRIMRMGVAGWHTWATGSGETMYGFNASHGVEAPGDWLVQLRNPGVTTLTLGYAAETSTTQFRNRHLYVVTF